MNFSDCVETNAEILSCKIKNCVNLIKKQILAFPKNDNECILCKEIFNFHNVHDLTKIYALFIYCLKFHCTKIYEIEEKNLCIVEFFLLDFFMAQENYDILYIIKYSENSNDKLYYEALKNQLIAVYKTYFFEKKFKIFCEQEIESLIYIYHKKQTADLSNSLNKDLLLLMLYKRKEYFRFMEVFKSIKKNYFNIKLAILLNIRDENIKEIKDLQQAYVKIVKENKHSEIEADNTIFNKKKIKDILCFNEKYCHTVEEVLDTFKKTDNIYEWTEQEKLKINWQNSVKMWAENRHHESQHVDNSMIDICIKYLNFEDGWIIFTNTDFVNTKSFIRGLNLCYMAIENLKHCKWKKRLVEVINNIFLYKSKIDFTFLLEVMLSKMALLPVNTLLKLIHEVQTNLVNITLKEVHIECIFNYYNLYCYNTRNPEICKICCQNAIYIYSKWLRSRSSIYIFRKKTDYDTKIYSHMLGICDISKNCDFFYKVCRDILQNDAQINRELCKRLQIFHAKNCRNCDYKKKQIVTVNESKGLMSHLFK